MEALSTVGFSAEEQGNIFRVIAAILLVGNIKLDDRADPASITDNAPVEKVCHVLGLDLKDLLKALLHPEVKAGRERVTQSRTRRQVIDEMGSLCKTLYEKTFSSIVDRINKALDRPTSKSTFIGVLDIAGFEIFESNSFEQLCINYTNEKLQQFFNHHMFVLEQEEYARENIDWDFVNFGLDLQPTIDLIESSSPIGILSCLDEECIMPRATDLTFTEKLNRIWSINKDGTAKDAIGFAIAKEKGVAHGSSKYTAARFAQGFTIKHYAGSVEYRTDGWLDKNKDPLNDNLTRIMSESKDRFIASLFAEYAADDENNNNVGGVFSSDQTVTIAATPKRRMKRGAFRTVAQRHKEQLNSLMSQLGSTQPHFVRCIVPNSEKKPGKMDVPLVLEQLRCNGVLEGIRIARLGYPNRLLFTEFRNRYEVLTPGIIPQGYMDGRKACQKMVDNLELDKSSFKVGLTKVFFKAGVLAELEERRDRHLHDLFSRFQAACRMYTARRQMKKILNRAAAVRTIQRNARLYVQLREWPWWQMYSKVRPLLKATRHDEELKRKQMELAMVTERAERDQKEKEALEALKYSLESEKKRIEAALESERALLLDKDQLLARSKERESTLEEEVTALQADVDQLDNQLERAMTGQRTTEQSRMELKAAFDAAAEHLIRLEAEQKTWKANEAQLMANVGKHNGDIERLQVQCKILEGEKAELGLAIQAKEHDLERANKRMKEAIAEVEMRLQGEVRNREVEQSKLLKLQEETRQSHQENSELARALNEYKARIQSKEVEIATALAKVQTVTAERDALAREMSESSVKVETLLGDLQAAKSEQSRTFQLQSQLQHELDETRRLMQAKSSEDSKQKELQRMKEEEVGSLRQDLKTLQDELAYSKHSSLEQINSLRAEAESAKKQHSELSKSHGDVKSALEQTEKKLAEMQTGISAAERQRRVVEGELQTVRGQISSHEAAVAESKQARLYAEQQLSTSNQKYQDLEDALLELERDQSAWKLKADQAKTELLAESKRRELIESVARQHEGNLHILKQQFVVREKEIASLKEELALTQVELKKTQSMTNKTIVEHVHVLEEAKKYTDRQLQDAQSKLQELAHYTKTLEKSKARLVSENEDLSRENNRLQLESRGTGRGVLTSATNVTPGLGNYNGGESKMVKSLEAKVHDLTHSLHSTRKERDEAQSNYRKKDLQMDESLSRSRQQYESRIAELEKELRGTQMARSTTYQILTDLVDKSSKGDDNAFRQKLLRELKIGHDELEQDIAAKAELLRNYQMNGGGSSSSSPTLGSKLAVKQPMSPFTKNGTNGIVTPSALKRASMDFTNGNRNGGSYPIMDAAERAKAEKRARDLQMQLNALVLQVDM